MANAQTVTAFEDLGKYMPNAEFQGFTAFMFGQHLYQPLIYMTKEQFGERPVLFQQEDKGSYIEKMLRMAVT